MSACRSTRSRQGIATFVAVVMIAMVGTALLAMTMLFQADTRRSMRHGGEVQLRQFLLIGAVAAGESIAQEPDTIWTRSVPLPDDLEEAEVSITYAVSEPTTRRVSVSARNGPYRASQQLIYELTATGWALRSVELQRQH